MDAVPSGAQAVLRFWFEECTEKQWFEKDPKLDETIRDRFGDLHRKACTGALEAWRETPEGCLALIILIDQFSRNLHRDDPAAFAHDPLAVGLVAEACEAAFDKAMTPRQQAFLYMPLMHSESLADQERCIVLMRDAGLDQQVDYAIRHRDIIARFGRFPHRNAVLGRTSTAEETAFLEQPNSSF